MAGRLKLKGIPVSWEIQELWQHKVDIQSCFDIDVHPFYALRAKCPQLDIWYGPNDPSSPNVPPSPAVDPSNYLRFPLTNGGAFFAQELSRNPLNFGRTDLEEF